MTEDNNHGFSGMQQSVLKGTYIIGEVIDRNDDYISYNGFNLKAGKSAVILESRYPGQEDALAEASIQLMDAFCKAHQDADYSKEEAFFDDDILYVVLKPETRLQNNEGKRQEEPKQDVPKDIHADRQSGKTDIKPKTKVILPVLIAAVCVVVLLIVIKFFGSNTGGETKSIDEVVAGDYITFGSYEQENDTSNGKEDIEWLVLDKEDDRLLVISKYALDCQPYHSESEEVTWETCSLRSWLNGDFLNNAFNSDEQGKILTTTVTADTNPSYETPPGNDTEDKVFLLSITEAEQYFDSDEARKCAPTSYAEAQGAYVSNFSTTAGGEAVCWWWLRSPGLSSYDAAVVYDGGSVGSLGGSVDNSTGAIRPALWIYL